MWFKAVIEGPRGAWGLIEYTRIAISMPIEYASAEPETEPTRWWFQGGSRLFVVPFGKAQQALKSSGADRLLIVAQRRLMLKTGEALALWRRQDGSHS